MSKDTVQNGLVVSMEYTLTVDGEELDSSEGIGPLEFLAGYDNIVVGLERGMIGMKVGESRDVVVAAEDGYGEFDEEAFLDVPRSEFPADMEFEEDLEMLVTDEDGDQQIAYVDSFDDEMVCLSFNHPLAGEELRFNVKVVGLREPTAEELDHGHVHEEGHHHE